jgi:hypothetical protein
MHALDNRIRADVNISQVLESPGSLSSAHSRAAPHLECVAYGGGVTGGMSAKQTCRLLQLKDTRTES